MNNKKYTTLKCITVFYTINIIMRNDSSIYLYVHIKKITINKEVILFYFYTTDDNY